MTNEELKTNYPGIPLAYDWSEKSYEWAIKRYDAWDGNIEKILTWGTTLTLGIFTIVVTKLQSIPNRNIMSFFTGCWFGWTVFFFCAALATCIWGKLSGKLTVIHPDMLYNKWLQKEEYTFKKDLVFFAAEHFDSNNESINQKWYAATFAAILFIAAFVSMAFWAIGAMA